MTTRFLKQRVGRYGMSLASGHRKYSARSQEAMIYDIETRVADVVAVLDAAGVATAHFWGYSEGGRMGVRPRGRRTNGRVDQRRRV